MGNDWVQATTAGTTTDEILLGYIMPRSLGLNFICCLVSRKVAPTRAASESVGLLQRGAIPVRRSPQQALYKALAPQFLNS